MRAPDLVHTINGERLRVVDESPSPVTAISHAVRSKDGKVTRAEYEFSYIAVFTVRDDDS